MHNNKFPENDGLTKDFCETFWNELKEIFKGSVLTKEFSETFWNELKGIFKGSVLKTKEKGHVV